MTSGPRRIRVTCAKCDYDKVRTLEAGDDRTLTQLSASLRCGGCRTWGKSGAISVSLVASSNKERIGQPVRETSTSQANSRESNHQSATAAAARKADVRPRHVHGTCLNCGHNENFKPNWRRDETLESLAREITCPECGAEGSAGNIYLREATLRAKQQRKNRNSLDIGASILATLAWPFEVLGLLIVIPLAALASVAVRLLERLWGPLLVGGSVMAAVAASVGAAYVAAVLIGAAMSGPAELVLRAAEHEHMDAVRNSPKGGYRERLDQKYAETPPQMTYYNRRSIGDPDRD